jgi:hypothetical protein
MLREIIEKFGFPVRMQVPDSEIGDIYFGQY